MRIGVLGGGQLGRMLGLAGIPLGMRFRFLDPARAAPAAAVGEHLAVAYDDPDGLARFADGIEVFTYELEHLPVESARRLEASGPVYPDSVALEVAQDRLREKEFFQAAEIPVGWYAPVDTLDALVAAAAKAGFPCLVKTRRQGYDGKGQVRLASPADVGAAWEVLRGVPCVVERWIPYEREVSLIGVRARSGEIRFYPLVENRHAEGILRLSLAPAPSVTPELQAEAERYVRRLLERLNYVGTLALELFQVEGRLVANEMAPRVHNSGHWTIEGAETSQFENHLRAIAGLPLGSTAPRAVCAMVNLIGTAPPLDALLRVPGAHVHLYDKQPAPGRKLGHVTLLAAGHDELLEKITEVC